MRPLWIVATCMLIEVGFPWCTALKATEVQHTTFLFPGTPAEVQAVVGGAESSADKTKGERTAVAGKGWAYRAALLSTTARCVLAFKAQGSPVVMVTDLDGKPIPSRSEKIEHQDSTRIHVASPRPLPSELRFHFQATATHVAVRDVQFTIWLPDRNSDGLSDSVEAAMGLSSSEHPTIIPRPPVPHTGFFFAQPYDATMAVPTDVVQLYGGTVAPDPII